MTGPRSREDVYVHLAAQLDGSASPAARTTERLRAMLSDLREPLARLSDARAVISTSLFRAARLPQLGGAAVVEHHDDRLARYDVAILVRLDDPDAVSDLLDHHATRAMLYVLHTHGQDVVITPARNVGAIADEPAEGTLSLIHHVLVREAADGDMPRSDAVWPAGEPTLTGREILIPIDPASTPLRSIRRAELAAARARELVIALARSSADGEAKEAATTREQPMLPQLYWEVSPRRESGRAVRGASGRTSVRVLVGASDHVLQHAHHPLLTIPPSAPSPATANPRDATSRLVCDPSPNHDTTRERPP